MRVSQEGNLLTLINVFETKPEQQQALLDQLSRFADAGATNTERVSCER